MNPIVVGISGASGAVLARDTVDELLWRDIPTVVVCSNGGQLVWREELGLSFKETLVEWQEHPGFTGYAINDLRAPIASGTYLTWTWLRADTDTRSTPSVSSALRKTEEPS